MTQTNKHHLADSNLSSDLPYQVANRRNLFRTIAPEKTYLPPREGMPFFMPQNLVL